MTINVAQSLALFAASLGLVGSLALPASAQLVLAIGENLEVSESTEVGEDAETGDNANESQNCFEMFLRSSQRDEVICTLALNNEIQGNLQDGGSTLYDGTFYHLHAIEGVAGQRVEIRLRSQDFAPTLTVLTVDEERWLSAMIGGGDSECGYEAQDVVTLTDTGSYIIMINHQSRETGGAYKLFLREVD
ncbi:hypothetical protein [Leptolyngbya sp. BL0902]|uniref:hypothetical protein n=1 Tax=Leptolyngbya sp. BL0902 TaxID=1115757 RepID=UPI0018E73C29|nr:hypothetical protein [Leptolyngbya sp. BL0902]